MNVGRLRIFRTDELYRGGWHHCLSLIRAIRVIRGSNHLWHSGSWFLCCDGSVGSEDVALEVGIRGLAMEGQLFQPEPEGVPVNEEDDFQRDERILQRFIAS